MNILSLDVESFGAVAGLPVQTCFHPRRCLHVDNVPSHHLLQVISLVPCAPLPNLQSLHTLTPTHAHVLRLSTHRLPLTHPSDRAVPSHLLPSLTTSHRLSPRVSLRLLCEWLSWADTLVGMNLPFDLSFLRHHHPALRALLNGRHTLLDLSYLNFLESDVRPERSLKTIGPVLGTHNYDAGTTARDHRFHSFSSLAFYCAQDSWNTVLAVRELAHRLSPMGGDKLSNFSIALNSDTLWDCIEMSDHGVPFHIPSLESLARDLQSKVTAAELSAAPTLLLSGPGSEKSKSVLLDAAIAELGPTILDDPLLQYTEKRRALSFSDANRTLLKSHLSPDSPLLPLFNLADDHAAALKLLSSYCYPLLYHRRNKPTSRTSILVPQPGVPPCPPRLPPSPPSSKASPSPRPTASTTSGPPPSLASSDSPSPPAAPTTPAPF